MAEVYPQNQQTDEAAVKSIEKSFRSKCADILAHFISEDDISIENIEASLNVLLLVTALTLSFALPLLTTFGHDDLLAADARLMSGNTTGYDPASYYAACDDLKKRPWGSVLAWRWCGLYSYGLFDAGYMSILFLTLGLIAGMSMYLAMCMSSFRDDYEALERWYSYFVWMHYLGYGFYFIGLIYWMLGLAYAVSIAFPWYASTGWWDFQTKQLVESFNVYAPWQSHQYAVQRSTLALAILFPFVSVFSTKYLNYGSSAEHVKLSKSADQMQAFLNEVCNDLNSITDKDKQRAARILAKEGYQTKDDLMKEVNYIDFNDDLPKFPTRVKRALLRYIDKK